MKYVYKRQKGRGEEVSKGGEQEERKQAKGVKDEK